MFGFFHKDRRRQKRHDCAIRAALVFRGDWRVAGMVVDVSCGGCRFFPHRSGVFLNSETAVLQLPDGRVDCSIRRRRRGHLHCRFHHPVEPTAITIWMGLRPAGRGGGQPTAERGIRG